MGFEGQALGQARDCKGGECCRCSHLDLDVDIPAHKGKARAMQPHTARVVAIV